MARSYAFTCDGCDRATTSRRSTLPQYWADIKIIITGYTNWTSGGGDKEETENLLCPSCQITLSSKCNPKSWARPEPSENES